MKFGSVIAIFAALVATSLAMEQPSFPTQGTLVITSADKALYVYCNGNPIGRAALEVKGRRLGEHVFTLIEGTTGKPSHLASGRQAGRWTRVGGEGRGVDAENLASRLRFSPQFALKVADEIAPGTTVILTDAPVVRKPVVGSTYFASN